MDLCVHWQRLLVNLVILWFAWLVSSSDGVEVDKPARLRFCL